MRKEDVIAMFGMAHYILEASDGLKDEEVESLHHVYQKSREVTKVYIYKYHRPVLTEIENRRS